MEVTIIGRLGSASTKAVLRLKELSVGQTVSADEMSALLTLDCGVDGPGRPAVRKAISHLLATDRINIAWDAKIKVWKRTNDSETVIQTFSDVKRARRCTKRGLQRVACVTTSNLDDSEQAEYRATATQLALAHIGLSDETREKIPQGETMIDSQRLLLSIRSIER